MQEKFNKMIKEEDKKKPLTDEGLAQKLFLNRSEVTRLRQILCIPDSRERRRKQLNEEIKKMLQKSPQISERNLTVELNKQGFCISRYSVSEELKELGVIRVRDAKEGAIKKTAEGETKNPQPEDPFSNMIGWDKSLRVNVEKAKAAILYPPNGLHTLIVGATGVGKSEMAECMYKFALEIKKNDPREFPFIIFNCSDYAENPQLLLAQLFGYKKGAFTGAETDKEGLVAKADGGILFLDEVHRLPPDGQEILFQLIDKGKYRKLGETNIGQEAKVMIIAATSEDIEKSLLATFRRRIPMIIELSSLSERPVNERLSLIKMFFCLEAARINKKIIVNYNALRTLLVYNYVGNIGQIKSDIQVACARGFLNYIANSNEQNTIFIDFSTLPVHVIKGLLNTQWNREEVENQISDDLVFLPHTMDIVEIKDDLYTFPKDIYKNVEEEFQKLQEQGLPDDVINRIIGDELEAKVRKIIRQIEQNKHKLLQQDLKKVVRPEIVDMVQEMIKIAKLGISEFDDTLLYCLATHLNASIERIKSGKRIANPQLESVKRDYPNEYKTAMEMTSLATYYLGLDLPDEEAGFIAMYLRTLTNKKMSSKDTIGIVVVTHGHVAEGMASVANRLLGVDLVQAVEMSFDEKPEIAYERTLDAVQKVHSGKGVLLLVDMGSLAGFGTLITKNTGINTRTVTRVDSWLVVDAIKKVLLPEADLDHVANLLIKGKSARDFAFDRLDSKINDRPIIISLCLTGEGTAKLVKRTIREKISAINNDIKIVTLGMLDQDDLNEQIEKLSENMNILSIVGTVNPRYLGIPFFSAAEIFKEGGVERLLSIIRNYKQQIKVVSDYTSSVFAKDLIIVNKDASDKYEVLNGLAKLLVKKGYVSPDYIKGVLQRESLGPTAVTNAIAIPHGFGDDIIKPGIGIMTLKQPVDWCDGIKIDLIFMLALKDDSVREFHRIKQIIKNLAISNSIKKAGNAADLYNILQNN